MANKTKYNIVELFSGIGSQAKALCNIGCKINVVHTCEWDIHAFVAYDAIHNSNKNIKEVDYLSREQMLSFINKYQLSNDGKNPITPASLSSYNNEILKRIYTAIKRTNNLVNIKNVSGKDIPSNVDILTYSFPCQDLSNVGAFHGYNKGIDPRSGSRSSLLWQVGRILQEMKNMHKSLPQYLIMENVPTLLSHRHIDNFNAWIEDLKDLGYVSQYFPLNARYFGIPQNRPRLIMISVFVGKNIKRKQKIDNYFKSISSSKLIEEYKDSNFFKQLSINDLLRIPKKYDWALWNEALDSTPNDTPSRRKIWNENPKIIDENNKLTKEKFIRTLTTKQDRHPNSGNIYFKNTIKSKSNFRYLTPRECLLFMGFTDKDYENIIENNPKTDRTHSLFSRDRIIKMAGNSIPVKLLEGVMFQLRKIDKLL